MKLALSPSLLPLLASAAVVAWISARANPLQARQHCLSCSGCSSDSCRTNQPGGLLLLTGFWDYSPATGPDDAWTIHGLWPDSCSGAQVSSCGTDRNYQNIGTILRNNGAEDVLDYMNQYWLDINGDDSSFWAHEWTKHGRCVSTLRPECYNSFTQYQDVVDYFGTVVSLHKRYSVYDALAAAGIRPSTSKTFTLSQLQAAMRSAFDYEATFKCKNNNLNEVWLYFHTDGQSNTADAFYQTKPIASNNGCPSSGIKYPPK